MKLYVVGKVINEPSNWEFCGVFSSEELAIGACTTEFHFVGPAILDEILSEDLEEWTDAYYPKGDQNDS